MHGFLATSHDHFVQMHTSFRICRCIPIDCIVLW